MARIYLDQDADLSLLKDRTVVSVGYGNQGHAQAQNLRDSGIRTLVGNRDDEYRRRALGDGFETLPIGEAAGEADVLLLLIPDEVQPEVYEAEILPRMKQGATLCFASGYNIHFGGIVPPKGVDAIMVAPRMIGSAVRRLYQGGQGFPCLVGAAADASPEAMPRAVAIARGIGATRLGAFHSSFEEETVIDLFAEQMLWPGIVKLCLLYFDKLVEAGCDPEVVATELHLSGEFVEIGKAMISEGFFEQLNLHSQTSQYGQLSRCDRMGPLELIERANRAMSEIRSGAFAREWAEEQQGGKPRMRRLWEMARGHPLSLAEARLEKLRKAVAAMQAQGPG